MDTTIIASIIGGVFTIGASIGTFAITRLFDGNSLPVTKNVRQISLTGSWEGTIHQEAGPNGTPIDSSARMRVKSTRRTVRGECIIAWPDREPQHVSLVGKFVYAQFLRMEYEVNNEPEAVQFGFILAELSPNGQILEGRFLGFGAASRNLVGGTFQYHKRGSGSYISAPSQTTV